ncbi:hypothetical protein PGTUg99_017947 [Puccinia graminis f. sp. tritici]|uniref:Uncharacterized protein n=1 Tax=Puccinia graminis f. sp. tritici TaxID=56615 RepID=A0A5B0RQF7_PUCGR|nr:hypothetical protein PGTUg99_017947 [Puccinia graminis f. sp. tritici]
MPEVRMMHSPDFWLWPDVPSAQMTEHQVNDPWVMLFHPRFQWEVGPAPILSAVPAGFCLIIGLGMTDDPLPQPTMENHASGWLPLPGGERRISVTNPIGIGHAVESNNINSSVSFNDPRSSTSVLLIDLRPSLTVDADTAPPFIDLLFQIQPTDNCQATSTDYFFCFCLSQIQPRDGSELDPIVLASTRTTSRFWRGRVKNTSRADPREAVKDTRDGR